MKRILVPIDFSDLTTDILDTAAKIAKANGGEVYVLHVAGPDSFSNDIPPQLPALDNPSVDQRIIEGQDLKAMVQYLAAQNIKAQYGLKYGSVLETILQEAEKFDADLIVVGAQSHGFLYRTFMGSVSDGIMRQSSCPVLIVPMR